jgi:hypothetical protein
VPLGVIFHTAKSYAKTCVESKEAGVRNKAQGTLSRDFGNPGMEVNITGCDGMWAKMS